MAKPKQLFERRQQRMRTSIRQQGDRPSAAVGVPVEQHIYAQIIDDVKGTTLAAASTRRQGPEGAS